LSSTSTSQALARSSGEGIAAAMTGFFRACAAAGRAETIGKAANSARNIETSNARNYREDNAQAGRWFCP